MEGYQKEKVRRIFIICTLVIIVVVIILVFGSLATAIVRNSYNPEDVLLELEHQVQLIPEDKPISDLGLKTAIEATDQWNSVVVDNAADALFYKSSMLLMCKESPFRGRYSAFLLHFCCTFLLQTKK